MKLTEYLHREITAQDYWPKASFTNYQGKPAFKTFYGGLIAIPIKIIITLFAFQQLYDFTLQRHLRSTFNKTHWDFEELGTLSLEAMAVEMGYIIVDNDMKVQELDPSLYDIEFLQLKHTFKKNPDGSHDKIHKRTHVVPSKRCNTKLKHKVPWLDLTKATCIDHKKFSF